MQLNTTSRYSNYLRDLQILHPSIMNENEVKVKNLSNGNVYKVTMSPPGCTCTDWTSYGKRIGRACKHMICAKDRLGISFVQQLQKDFNYNLVPEIDIPRLSRYMDFFERLYPEYIDDEDILY